MDESHEAQSSTTAFSSDAPPFVFLSYAHADRDLVKHLQADLRAHGIAVWMDYDGIQPGTPDWEEALRKAIRDASAVVLAASPEAGASRYVKDELRIAEMYKRPVYPLWIAGSQWLDVAPIGWGGMQYLDGRDERYTQAVEDLVATLSRSKVFLGTLLPSSPPISFSPEPSRNPYKGLRAFLREDARDFFGRSHLTGQLVEAVKGVLSLNPQAPVTNLRFLSILGPSGSGKSSVVMAGLLPQLQQGILPQSQEWIYIEPIVPGQHPIEGLTVVLSEHFPVRSLTSIRQDLEADTTRGLHLLMTSLTKRSNTKVVLLIDQFEEVFTQTSSEEERRRFLDLLITASTEPHGPVIVVVTLRADFYDRPLHYPELAPLIEAHRVLVLPMELQGLREVIEKPAQLPDVQLTFEQDLVGDLLFEVQGQPGALPLLQFTLDQLYERRKGQQLTRQAYQDIGGVKGALAKHAEATYLSLPSEDHRRLWRALFLRLIDPGAVDQDATRRRAARSDLVLSDPKETETLEEVMTTFTQARLLTTNTIVGISTVEISHEALIWTWPRLTKWLEETHEDIRLQKAINEDAAEWQRYGQAVDRLYRGTQLSEALAWSARNIPSRAEEIFLQASVAQQNRQRQYTRRKVLGGLVAGVGLIAATSIASILFTRSSQERIPQQHLPYSYKGHTNTVYSVAWSPDGKRLASAGGDNTVQVMLML